jgi:hypothetical protein
MLDILKYSLPSKSREAHFATCPSHANPISKPAFVALVSDFVSARHYIFWYDLLRHGVIWFHLMGGLSHMFVVRPLILLLLAKFFTSVIQSEIIRGKEGLSWSAPIDSAPGIFFVFNFHSFSSCSLYGELEAVHTGLASSSVSLPAGTLRCYRTDNSHLLPITLLKFEISIHVSCLCSWLCSSLHIQPQSR